MSDFYQVRIPRASSPATKPGATGPQSRDTPAAPEPSAPPAPNAPASQPVAQPPAAVPAMDRTTLAPRPAPLPETSGAPPRARGTSPDIALIGIYEISKILSSGRRLEATLANVVNVLSSMLQMRHGMIVILDPEGEPDMVATTGWTPQIASQIRARVPQKATDQIVATSTPLVVHDVAADALFEGHVDLFEPVERAKVSFIGVPIKADARVIGTLSIDRIWDGSVHFRFDDDVRFLTMVANLVGQTVRLHDLVARDRDRLIAETHRLEKALTEEAGVEPQTAVGILGESLPVKRLVATARIVARSNSTVLLRGESGTGKELFARAIHELSPRADKPFIRVNCAALPEAVLESELFGHEKGAFTGALNMRQGRFELAHGGTLFLDEIGEISAAFQAKLLRVLQEGEFERVGGNKTLKVDVRLVCATNKDLEQAVTRGEFRADLYYRINVVPLILPPLRERPGDIEMLARAFLDRFNRENKRRLALSDSAIAVLMRCYFPGNVRELENCVRRTATLAREAVISSHDFACDTGQCLSAVLWKGSAPKAAAPAAIAAPVPLLREPLPVADEPAVPANCPGTATCPAAAPRLTEKEQLLDAMERSGWVQAKAARMLNLTPRQIGYALRKHGIDIKRF